MKKEEFLEKLKKQLEILDENEIKDIIEEYTGYIDEKMQNGATEEEAIKDFGDIDELATELLKAYKINVEKNKSEKNWMNNAVEKFNECMDSIIQVFSNKDSGEILRIIVEIFIIVLGIGLCKIPFRFLEELGYNVFMVFQNGLGKGLYNIWKFIIEFAYLIFGIVLFAKIFKKRYLKDQEKVIKISKEEIQPKKSKTKEMNSEKIVEQVVVEKNKKGLLDFLTTICIWFIKFIVFWILFGIACYILGLGMCVGICLFLMVKGVAYYGIYFSIIILLILGVLAFIWLFNWMINRKNNWKFLLITFIISFIGLGISFSYASIEIATTEFINAIPNEYNTETITETVSMNDQMILIGNFDYVVNETLETELRIEYTYQKDFYTIKPYIDITNQNKVYINWDYTNHTWNTNILNDIINDLKEHKIHNYTLIPTIKVYTSSTNISKLKENLYNWKDKKKYNESLYEICEEQLENQEELSSYCRSILFPNENI